MAAALGLSSAFLVACGDRNNLIPRSDADKLKSNVDAVASATARKNCARATTALQRAQETADNLPSSVDPKLRRNIDAGLSRLVQNVESECSKTTTTATTNTTPTTTETTPTFTETTPTSTTTPPPTTDTTSQPPPPGTNGTGGTSPGQRSPQD
jgi:hypothetical protein